MAVEAARAAAGTVVAAAVVKAIAAGDDLRLTAFS